MQGLGDKAEALTAVDEEVAIEEAAQEKMQAKVINLKDHFRESA